MLKPTAIYLVLLERPVGKSIVTDTPDPQEAVEFAEWAYMDAMKNELELCAVYILRVIGVDYDRYGQFKFRPDQEIDCYLSPEGHVNEAHDWTEYLETVARCKTWNVQEEKGAHLS